MRPSRRCQGKLSPQTALICCPRHLDLCFFPDAIQILRVAVIFAHLMLQSVFHISRGRFVSGQHVLLVGAVEAPGDELQRRRQRQRQTSSCARYRILCDVFKVEHAAA